MKNTRTSTYVSTTRQSWSGVFSAAVLPGMYSLFPVSGGSLRRVIGS
jgi:hypothetical protein